MVGYPHIGGKFREDLQGALPGCLEQGTICFYIDGSFQGDFFVNGWGRYFAVYSQGG